MVPEQIAAGARTVTHVAAHFARLKAEALELAGGSEVGSRGYFKPGEEERTRHLQISYWQARNALFELVDGYRHDVELPEELYPAAFLVAYAGALLLVDSARFLREQFHGVATIRHKLDEPDQQFGIPPRMYESVQKSLTSTRHAWHLYHAIHYFENHEAELRRQAADLGLEDCLEIIDRLSHRVDVSLTAYAKTKLRVRSRQFSRYLGRDWVGRAVYGLQKLASSMISDVYVHRGHKPGVPAEIARLLTQRLVPGDVLIVRKEYAVTNYFLPGFWPHAALYLGDAGELAELGIEKHENVRPRWAQLARPLEDGPRRVLESMKDGVRIRSVASPLASDSVVLIRPQLSRDEIAQGLSRGLAHEGKPYDFDFDFSRSERLVCTEVVYRAYDGIGPIEFQLTRRAGRNTLASGDLIQMALAGRGFRPVALYCPAHSPDLLDGSPAEQVLREKCPSG